MSVGCGIWVRWMYREEMSLLGQSEWYILLVKKSVY
jgi:hypothetical protein